MNEPEPVGRIAAGLLAEGRSGDSFRVVAGHAGSQIQVAYECFQDVRGHTGRGLAGSVHVLSLQYPVVAGVQPSNLDS